jgi:F-type H+-transporting ATPase subunit a
MKMDLESQNIITITNDTKISSQTGGGDTIHKAVKTEEESVFKTILNENIGNHTQFSWFDAFHVDLPKIIIDKGIHIYKDTESMEKGGEFTYVQHKLVRKEDNTPPALDLSITSLVVYEWIALLLLGIAFWQAGKHYKKHPFRAPHGFTAMIETVIDFVKNDIVKPNIGEKLTNKILPYFLGIFFFILTMNLLGLLPGGHAATGNLAVTAALAITAFCVIQGVSIWQIGFLNWLKHLTGGAPIYLAFIMVPIEIIGLLTKPFALTIRLFANMTAGHIIILCLLGLILYFKSIYIAPAAVGFSLFIYALELLVALLQAYIFTILTAVFVGLALGDHAEEHSTEH